MGAVQVFDEFVDCFCKRWFFDMAWFFDNLIIVYKYGPGVVLVFTLGCDDAVAGVILLSQEVDYDANPFVHGVGFLRLVPDQEGSVFALYNLEIAPKGGHVLTRLRVEPDVFEAVRSYFVKDREA